MGCVRIPILALGSTRMACCSAPKQSWQNTLSLGTETWFVFLKTTHVCVSYCFSTQLAVYRNTFFKDPAGFYSSSSHYFLPMSPHFYIYCLRVRMLLFVVLCVCACVRLCGRVCIYVYARVRVWMYVCVCVCACVLMYIVFCAHVCARTCVCARVCVYRRSPARRWPLRPFSFLDIQDTHAVQKGQTKVVCCSPHGSKQDQHAVDSVPERKQRCNSCCTIGSLGRCVCSTPAIQTWGWQR